MDHKMNDPAFIDRAQLFGSHAEVSHVVGQEMAGRRQEECEQTGEDEQEAGEPEQRPAIADQCLQ